MTVTVAGPNLLYKLDGLLHGRRYQRKAIETTPSVDVPYRHMDIWKLCYPALYIEKCLCTYEHIHIKWATGGCLADKKRDRGWGRSRDRGRDRGKGRDRGYPPASSI